MGDEFERTIEGSGARVVMHQAHTVEKAGTWARAGERDPSETGVPNVGAALGTTKQRKVPTRRNDQAEDPLGARCSELARG